MPGDGHEAARFKEEQDSKVDYDSSSDPEPAGEGGDLAVLPEPGGYGTRDPKTEMPVVPSVPEDEIETDPHETPSGGDRPAHD